MDRIPAAASALVFDCDGLLADTQACWDSAFRIGASDFGVALNPEQLRQLRGASVDTAAAFIVARATRTERPGAVPDQPAVARRINARLLAAIEDADLRALPGVEETLDRLAWLPRGVASNAPRDVLRRVLQRLKLEHAFQVVLSAEDVAAPKPAPDAYLLACARLGVAPARAIALEDSLAGIAAAMAAGLSVIAVTAETETTPANLTVGSLSDAAARVWLDARLGAPARTTRET